ncbi:MAG: S8 family serine peptidase [Bdellovibrio sp.]
MQKMFLGVLFLSGLITGCTPSQKASEEISHLSFLDGLYSTRPSVEEPGVLILKLSNPALLEVAQRENGVLKIDKDLHEAILKEQKKVEEDLLKISPGIRILIRYKLVLNALAVWIPTHLEGRVRAVVGVTAAESSFSLDRPALEGPSVLSGALGKNSVDFIGAEAAYAQDLKGQGMRVGIIDTGIDYTHKMLGGVGTKEVFGKVDPAQSSEYFPNDKVVGGIDLVGTEFNAASPDFQKRIPRPDSNPLDEGGHGSHVAGTVAGLGDGVNTYSGVAPEAKLYAIKVFGAEGSTNSDVVIAGLEYAADPTGDLSFSEQMDVVNLSLGSSYGTRHTLYTQAIHNLVKAGTIVVAASGNSGDKSFITGSPGVSEDAISVASGVDDSKQNTEVGAIEFESGADSWLGEFVEANFTSPLKDIASLSGEIIFMGTANKDFDENEAAQIKGKIVLIDRGVSSFEDKVVRGRKAGAKAVIVANNQSGDPLVMSLPKPRPDGEREDIFAGMITKEAGDAVKAALREHVVIVNMKSEKKISKNEVIDTISTFSSRGPRSDDGLIKPEIVAPGSNIISAGKGLGDLGTIKSGTSMAAPHIAGVMVLLKQKFQFLTEPELRSVLMGQAKVISDRNKNQYPVSRQGAGRVQVEKSLQAKVISIPASLSFGITDLEKQKTMVKELVLKNISDSDVTLQSVWQGSKALQVSVPGVTLKPGESKKVTVRLTASAAGLTKFREDLDGHLQFKSGEETLLQIPALLGVRRIAQVKASSARVYATSAADAAGSLTEVELHNEGLNKGSAYLFNLISLDERKKDFYPDPVHNRHCDLQSAGYRLVERNGGKFLQVAVKLYEGLTTWNNCEVNMQIDSDGDGVADQELAGLLQADVSGLSGDQFVSVLLDAGKARVLRKQFEEDFHKDPATKEDYKEAVLGLERFQIFDSGTLAFVETDVTALKISPTGELRVKISTSQSGSELVEVDDYLGNQAEQWFKLSPVAASFAGIPEVVELKAGESKVISLLKGYGSEELILYAPHNREVRDVLLEDSQSQIIPTYYKAE